MDQTVATFRIQKPQLISRRLQVVNEHDEICYHILRRFFSIGRTLIVSDASEQQVAKIRQRFSLITPKYRISINGCKPITIQRKLTLRPAYQISGMSWHISADHTGRYHRGADANGSMLFEAERISLSWLDRYFLSVRSEADLLRSLCITLVIDSINEDMRNSSSD